MDGVLIDLKVDRIVRAAVWCKDHGQRVDGSLELVSIVSLASSMLRFFLTDVSSQWVASK